MPMRFISLLLRALAFLLLLGLAVKNDGLVTVQAYLGSAWQLPLVVVMLVAFVLGLACGIVAISARMLAQTRELTRLRALVAPVSRPVTSTSIDTDAGAN